MYEGALSVSEPTSQLRRGLTARASRTSEDAAPLLSRAPIAGRYFLRSRLGHGGMGEVMLADDLLLGRAVAVKRSRTPETDVRQGRRLHREATIAARFAHRAIVRVFDIVREDDIDHMVLELVTGGTLHELVKQGPLAPIEVVRVALELADALACVHAQGIVHLDVKSENVLMAADRQPKLTDFGIARDEASVLDEAQLMGTPRVMSPEQIMGGTVDTRSDLYSLGVLMYELLTARSPFMGECELHTLARVLHDTAPRVEALVSVPQALDRLVAELLEKEPARRPQRAIDVQHRLRAIAELA